MNDDIMPHVDFIAKLELEAINELLCDGFAGAAAVALGHFLDSVHILRSRGLESFTSDETHESLENPQAEESQKENASEGG